MWFGSWLLLSTHGSDPEQDTELQIAPNVSVYVGKMKAYLDKQHNVDDKSDQRQLRILKQTAATIF